MKAAARAIVRHLGLSGMCGFDFMLDDASGDAHLIEINPRATQVNHLRLGAGHDLPTALRLALEGLSQPVPAPVAEVDIALFPQEWSRDRSSPHLLATATTMFLMRSRSCSGAMDIRSHFRLPFSRRVLKREWRGCCVSFDTASLRRGGRLDKLRGDRERPSGYGSAGSR